VGLGWLSASTAAGWRAGDGSEVPQSRHGHIVCLTLCPMGLLLQGDSRAALHGEGVTAQ